MAANERDYWAAKGRKQLGPYPTREIAEAIGREWWGAKARFSTGYGIGGAFFDLRGVGPSNLLVAHKGGRR